MPLIVFRADGGRSIGAGHVMRSLALASIFRNHGWSGGFAASAETFASVAALNEWPLERLVLASGANEEAAAMRAHWPDGVDVLVIDHYKRDVALERACRGWTRQIVVLDDLADRPHDADFLVDVANSPGAYRNLVPNTCAILTGTRYAILDEAFAIARDKAMARRGASKVERVLVSFGQIDVLNATQRALAALVAEGFGGDIDVVLGHAAPHLGAIKAAAGPHVRIHVDANNMPALMTATDVAIGAGGVTALERCCLGLPTIMVTIADNQRKIAAMLKTAGAVVDAGEVDGDLDTRLARMIKDVVENYEMRAAMTKAGTALVDGQGAERIYGCVVRRVP